MDIRTERSPGRGDSRVLTVSVAKAEESAGEKGMWF